MLTLNKLEKTHKKRKRVGRGGKLGGTSGRGHKGQKARSGSHNVKASFEGGQMPLTRRLPRRGFSNRSRVETLPISLEALNERFVEGASIDKAMLIDAGLAKRTVGRIKILGGFELNKKFVISADAFSASAKNALENAGGEALLKVEG